MRTTLKNTATKKYWEIESQASEQLIRSSAFDYNRGRAHKYTSRFKAFASDALCAKDTDKKIKAQQAKGFEVFEAASDTRAYPAISMGDGKHNDVFRVRAMLEAGHAFTTGELGTLAGEGAIDVLSDLAARGVPMSAGVMVSAANFGKDKVLRWGASVGLSMDALAHDMTPLMMASQKGKSKAVIALLELGADPQVTDSIGLTAAHHAAIGPSLDCLKRLTQAGADVGVADQQGRTPLTLACKHGQKAKRPKAQAAFKELIEVLLPLSPTLEGEWASYVSFIGLSANSTPVDGSMDALLGKWSIHKTTTLDSSDDDPNWDGPRSDGQSGHSFIEFQANGTCLFTRHGDSSPGTWSANGQQLKVQLRYMEPELWTLIGDRLERPDYDEEHGARFVDSYRRG